MTSHTRRLRGREIRKQRRLHTQTVRAFQNMGLSFEAAGHAADQAARTMVKVGKAFTDPTLPTIHELNSMKPLKSVQWAGFDIVEP